MFLSVPLEATLPFLKQISMQIKTIGKHIINSLDKFTYYVIQKIFYSDSQLFSFLHYSTYLINLMTITEMYFSNKTVIPVADSDKEIRKEQHFRVNQIFLCKLFWINFLTIC